jgi:hypothetical protein
MLAVVKHKHIRCHCLGCDDEAVLRHVPAAKTTISAAATNKQTTVNGDDFDVDVLSCAPRRLRSTNKEHAVW